MKIHFRHTTKEKLSPTWFSSNQKSLKRHIQNNKNDLFAIYFPFEWVVQYEEL